jgi:DNA-binding MarR family transcriptional regulator
MLSEKKVRYMEETELNHQLMQQINLVYRHFRLGMTQAIAGRYSGAPEQPIKEQGIMMIQKTKRLSDLKDQYLTTQQERVLLELCYLTQRSKADDHSVSLRRLNAGLQLQSRIFDSIVAKLQQLGDLTLTPDGERVLLTQQGSALAEEYSKLHMEVSDSFLKPLTPEERETLLTLLGKLNLADTEQLFPN